MHLSARTRGTIWILFFAVLWFGNLQYRDLFQTDEGRYAEIPREMLVTGNWVTPRLDGFKYFEKPPLQYWTTAIAFSAFGEHNWTARLWTALTGFACVLLVFAAGRRLFGHAVGLSAALMLAGSLYYIIMGHFNTLDMGLAFFMSVSLFSFLLAQASEEGSGAERNWMYLAWGAAALAMLSKGLEGVVLPGGALLLYSLVWRDWSPWRRLHPVGGVFIFAIIACPWFVLVSRQNPEFLHFFFIHEHVERYLTKIHHRYQPWWYFVPLLVIGILPWWPQFVRSVFVLFQQRRRPDRPFSPLIFLWVWTLFIFIFFSFSDSKLGSYILPVFPALAILIGRQLAADHGRYVVVSAVITGFVALGAAIYAPSLPHQGSTHVPAELYRAWVPWILSGTGIMLVGAAVAAVFATHSRIAEAVGVLAVAWLAGGQVVTSGAQALSPSYSTRSLVQQIGAANRPGVPIYSVKTYDQSLPFYLKRTVIPVVYQGELEFGMAQAPQLWIPDMGQFVARWKSEHEGLAVMPRNVYVELHGQGLPMRVIGESPDLIAVEKP